MIKNKPRLIAFYLPQFHPIPENDNWWGSGFTEWFNVVKAQPLFKNHYQPHLPADLGFYDLRLAESRRAQAEMAQHYEIHGFCYYHYWFQGKQLLSEPLNQVLSEGKPEFPFCLCWANESWRRTWDGRSGELLIEQTYSDQDDYRHMEWLCQVFTDNRYIRYKDKPLFLVYRARELPNPLKTTHLWRKMARRLGVGEIYLCCVESFSNERGDPKKIGFDAAVEFQPDWKHMGAPISQSNSVFTNLIKFGMGKNTLRNTKIYDYESIVQRMLQKKRPSYPQFSSVFPSWDNSPRRKSEAVILINSSPELYGKWLSQVIEMQNASPSSDTLIFVNAWNEWGEGNHLEPCQLWGNAYLEATKQAMG